MTPKNTSSEFTAELLCPESPGDDQPWAFVILPKEVSEKLPRRGRVTVEGSVNGHEFRVLLEPDGQKSHWLKLNAELLLRSGLDFGDEAHFDVEAVDQEPEPEVPPDFREALNEAPEAKATWDSTTAIARLDWVHWVTSAKQAKTRAKRINDACDMLASGKKRVCCFDPSGYYSKAFSAPKAV
ncbi:YdeI/OmpD-associated family protein [Marinimicrobium agarilyticum]|uniref:YdeI/OmpD-associated family protein n=1 Tax=Marinimicrobium agarilyticum TaxID=306546 RepID=UPI000484F423|nr:YdeI/OmpD-associated family protein [Marinimicrobium agarilyticum]